MGWILFITLLLLYGLGLLVFHRSGSVHLLLFAAIAVLATLLALGRYVHLFDLLRFAVPIFRTMRAKSTGSSQT